MEATSTVSVTTGGKKWYSSPVTSYRGPLEQLREYIPHFSRRTFGHALLPAEDFDDQDMFKAPLPPGFNSYYDAIVRMPFQNDAVEIPVGIVSKQYSLIQHHELLGEALNAIRNVKIDPSEIVAELDLTAYGERMRLGLIFPERYNLKVSGNDEMGLRLECFNSVDGSMKFMSVIGWLRFVCANGMVIGVADSYYRSRHNRYMELSDIAAILKGGIAATTKQRELFQSWQKKKVSEDKLRKWVDGPLAKKWGVKAAFRTWHITRTGKDAMLADPFEKGKPTEKNAVLGITVPGAVLPGNTVYAVSQSLSWLAKERRDVQEQLEWKQEIPDLLVPLCA